MKKILVLFLGLILIDYSFANHNDYNLSINPYFSPGFQIGYGESFFVSIQLTSGFVHNGNDFLIYPGATIGKRFYRKSKSWDSYNYYDVQCSLIGLVGIGFGKLYNNSDSYYKYKIWAGALGLLSYDYLQPINSDYRSAANHKIKYNPETGELIKSKLKHNFGIFGVIPIFDFSDL